MYDYLKEQLEGVQDLAIRETPNYHAMITLRRVLIELDKDRRVAFDTFGPTFSESEYGSVAARCKLDLSALDDLDQVEELITLFATFVFKLMITLYEDGFSVEDIYAMAERDLKLELK